MSDIVDFDAVERAHNSLDQVMKGLDPDLFPVLLTHRPTGFEQACDVRIPLTLCGHTHGGDRRDFRPQRLDGHRMAV